MYRDLLFENGTIVPTDPGLRAGKDSVYELLMEEIGVADYISDTSKAINVVDVKSSLDQYPIHAIAIAYKQTFFNERTNQANDDIPANQITARKQFAAKRAIAERANLYAAYGDVNLSVTGFVNNANVTIEDNNDNLYGLSPSELYDYFVNLQFNAEVGANYTLVGDCLAVPPQVYNWLEVSKLNETLSVLEALLRPIGAGNPAPFAQINKAKELVYSQLEANGVETGGTNKDRIVLYPFDADVQYRMIEPTQMMPQEWWSAAGGVREIPMFMCMTPAIVSQPLSMRYVKIAKKAGSY
jgi:hypothetical protein